MAGFKKTTQLLFLVILTMGCTTMNKTVNKMFDKVDTEAVNKVSEEDLKPLPQVVQNYLRFTNIIGKEKIKTVRLKQGGGFRLKPEDEFKTLKAVQYFNLEAMEFIWQGKVSVITATDRFLNGKGDMTVKLLGFIKMASAEGPEVNQGEVVRFLAEGVWFPSVFLNDYIRWQALDERSAKATITLGDFSVSATFHFNEKNQVEKITTRRYMEKDGRFELEDWEIRIVEYSSFNDVFIPRKSEVVWKLDGGDFCWYKPEIYTIEYNISAVYK